MCNIYLLLARPSFPQRTISNSTNQTVLCFDNLEQIRSLQKVGCPYEDKICKTKRRFVEIYRARHAIRQISSLTENSTGIQNGWKGVTTNNLSFSIITLVLTQKATTFHFICSTPESRCFSARRHSTSNVPHHPSSIHPLICSYERIPLLIPLSITSNTVISANRRCKSGNISRRYLLNASWNYTSFLPLLYFLLHYLIDDIHLKSYGLM